MEEVQLTSTYLHSPESREQLVNSLCHGILPGIGDLVLLCTAYPVDYCQGMIVFVGACSNSSCDSEGCRLLGLRFTAQHGHARALVWVSSLPAAGQSRLGGRTCLSFGVWWRPNFGPYLGLTNPSEGRGLGRVGPSTLSSGVEAENLANTREISQEKAFS